MALSVCKTKKDKAEREAFKAEQAKVWAAADEKNMGYRQVDSLMSQLQTSITDMKTDTSSLTTKDDSGTLLRLIKLLTLVVAHQLPYYPNLQPPKGSEVVSLLDSASQA